MKRLTLAERLRYRFDLTMARGPASLIAWLFVVTALFVVAAASIIVVLDLAPKPDEGDPPGLVSTVWSALMHAMDAGTVAGDSGSRLYLGVMFVVTLGGIFIVSILVGLITSSIQGRVESLRKGRSLVCEENHTVIIGWSPQVFSILSELAIANQSRKGAAIAILAEKDKVEMEDEIRDKCGDLRGTRVICRTGSSLDPADIALVRPDAARSMIVLAPEDDDPDSYVIKTLLALINAPGRKTGKYHVVAEIRDRQNLEAARLVGRDEALFLCTEDILSRITVQTCLQSGLSAIYTELLDFGGDEIYMLAEPALAGKTFGEALHAYEHCAVIGLLTEDNQSRILPPLDLRIGKGDKIIAIAEDDSTLTLAKATPFEEKLIVAPKERAKTSESVLILGWNRRASRIVLELDSYVTQGSKLTILAESPSVSAEVEELKGLVSNLAITFMTGAITQRSVLGKLAANFNHIITLSYSDDLPAQKADARTLVTLLHLRDIESKRGESFSIVSEMLDVRNRALAEVAEPDDFIVSDKLISLLLAQISENANLASVFEDLFDPEGAEIYLKPAGDYVALDKPARFATVVEAARRRGEIAIGFLKESSATAKTSSGAPSLKSQINPKKGHIETFAETDKVIVIAEQ